MAVNIRKIRNRICAAGGLLALAGAGAFMIAPGKTSPEVRAQFCGRNYAHRGLFRNDGTVPENSLPAFEAAARIGYGIELDVHITKDSHIVVFHDDSLERVCGIDARIEDMTLEELSGLRLLGTDCRIPLLTEVLSTVRGRSPLIVEFKRGSRNKKLCRLTYEILKNYDGRWCMESFDPFIVLWFRIHAPEVLRGQLACDPREFSKNTSKFNAFIVGNLLTNFLARPQFISYGIGRKPLTVRICEKMGAIRVAWTSLNKSSEKKNDMVIFQFYRPVVKYK